MHRPLNRELRVGQGFPAVWLNDSSDFFSSNTHICARLNQPVLISPLPSGHICVQEQCLQAASPSQPDCYLALRARTPFGAPEGGWQKSYMSHSPEPEARSPS